jgi:hypothetical protein
MILFQLAPHRLWLPTRLVWGGLILRAPTHIVPNHSAPVPDSAVRIATYG